MKHEFSSAHLEKDFHTIMEFNTAGELFFEVCRPKDRDGNNVYELTIVREGYGVIDTYTYYRFDMLTKDIVKVERNGINMIEL